MESARSLRTRAVLALLLMVGFYVFAITLAAALIVIPVAITAYGSLAFAKVAIFSAAAGATILYAIAPRIDKFVPPGPRLMPEDAPRLFQIIDDVAEATGQSMPKEVYLLPDANAFVGHRGGLMGIGSRRVMGVGMPLIATFSTSELRSVIAHEFGHYVSGDVALGPWIYKTRNAIVRAVVGVSETEWLREIFLSYMRMFMRMTMQISREQEFVADATAARIAGAATMMSALKRMEVVIPAYTTYVRRELIPILQAGYLPPHSEGFNRYLRAPQMYEAFESFARQAAKSEEVGQYDSHPPTAERIAAIEKSSEPTGTMSDEPALTLLDDPVAQDRAVVQFTIGEENYVKLRAIAWEQLGETAFPRILEERVNEWAWWLRRLSAEKIPSDAGWFVRSGHDMLAEQGPAAPDDFKRNLCVQTLSYAIALLLLRAGWTVVTGPGEPIVMVKDGVRFTGCDAIGQLADGSMPADQWRAKCSELGIAGVLLATSPIMRKAG